MSSAMSSEDRLTDRKYNLVKSPKELRVFIATPSYHVLDGVSLTIRKIRDAVLSHGGKILIATCNTAEEELKKLNDPAYLNGEMLFVRSEPVPYDSTDKYAVCRMLDSATKKRILDFKPTVMHFTSPDLLAFSIGEWCRKKKYPLIATWHSNIPDYLDHTGFFQKVIVKPILISAFKMLYSYPLITYVPQEALLHKMKALGYENKAMQNKLRVWGRGVDTTAFNPSKRSIVVRKELGIQDDKQIIILWVGRCVNEKNPEVFMHVLKKLHEKYPKKVVGVVVGRGEVYEQMVSLPNVMGVGWKGRDELAQIYASSDILLFPSNVETFGNVTLEGMSSGIPCVVDVTCSSHLIENKVNGFTCKTDVLSTENMDSYFDACEYLVVHDKERAAMGRRARDIAVNKWETKVILDQMVGNYLEASNWEPKDMPDIKHDYQHLAFKVVYEVTDKGAPVIIWFGGKVSFIWPGFGKTLFSTSTLIAFTGTIGYLFAASKGYI